MVYFPYALERKYSNANKEWGCQYVFPAARISTDPCTGIRRRHHIYETVLQKAVKQAIRKAGIAKQASGGIYLAANKVTPTPEILIAIGSAAVGALAGLLTPAPGSSDSSGLRTKLSHYI